MTVGLFAQDFALAKTLYGLSVELFTVYLFETLSYGMVAVGFFTFCLLFFVTAPYGRHTKEESSVWGPLINAR